MYELKQFYRGAKVTLIGAISLKQVLAVMTLNGSIDGNAIESFAQTLLSTSVMVRCGRGYG